MKKRRILILIVLFLGLITLGIILFLNKTYIREYKTDDFLIKYDSTWKVLENDNNIKLRHRKSGSILEIQCKVLENNYIDTNLKDIIEDVLESIEKQNEGYKLISRSEQPSNKYESFSYLYEKDNVQALVNIYKKDNKLIIIYYVSETKYYDIVLDSVDSILDSLEIITGEGIG